MNALAIKYRVRYYWRKTVTFLGFCPDCWTVGNRTRTGRLLCPHCGRAK